MEEAVRPALKPPAPDVAPEPKAFLETKRSLSTEGAIDDGSWGQLAFARKLEEEGKHSERQKVLISHKNLMILLKLDYLLMIMKKKQYKIK